MWKLVVEFKSYGLIRLLEPSGQNVVCRSKTPKSQSFWKFHYFIESNL